MKLTLIIASAIALGTVLAASRPQRRLLIAGDSTAQTYDTVKTLQRGWGQMAAWRRSYSFSNPGFRYILKASRFISIVF